MAVANSQLHDACEALKIAEPSTVTALIGVLDEASKVLAADEEFRFSFSPLSLAYPLTCPAFQSRYGTSRAVPMAGSEAAVDRDFCRTQ